jgi:hypothetical protein
MTFEDATSPGISGLSTSTLATWWPNAASSIDLRSESRRVSRSLKTMSSFGSSRFIRRTLHEARAEWHLH